MVSLDIRIVCRSPRYALIYFFFCFYQKGHCCATGYACKISPVPPSRPFAGPTPTCSIIWQKFLIKCERQTHSSDSSCNSNSNSSCSCTQRAHSTLSLSLCLPSPSLSPSYQVMLHVCLTLHICSNIGYSWYIS